MSPSISVRVLRAQSDARLVELARGGHERAFEALIHRYRKPLLSYCRRLLLPEARAEDALQQGLLHAWLALREGCEVRNAKAWLYRIVHNAAVSTLRRSGYDYVELNESLHGASALESDLDRRIAVRETLAGLAALPDSQREALLRTAVQGESHEQVAAALGLSEGAIRGMVYRARATLRAAATALTPPQLVLWAARAAQSGSGHAQISEIAGGAGSAGLLGALLKGGAVVLSAGVLAAGATSVVERGHGGATARADSARQRAAALAHAGELGAAPSANAGAIAAGGARLRRGGSAVPGVAHRSGSAAVSRPPVSVAQPFGGGVAVQGASGGASASRSGASSPGPSFGTSGDASESGPASDGGGPSSPGPASGEAEPGGGAGEAEETQTSPGQPPAPPESGPKAPAPGGEAEPGSGSESAEPSGDAKSSEPKPESEPGS